ncbi:FHA domain-containing protein [Ktedonosporobacter rubrisoli]|uniref:non-specific serine/threonine protein kinase n=1 Tax=Ktedonosporobacter rubrisoli TaxID=2509675 RepID=A0A4P6JRD8_KTERU|nr:protein kinase [Ktedonosporobacter rubrisoli]QBD78019.1 FHA domain-containing protein [Ktedonosporobacter rubrisoli]
MQQRNARIIGGIYRIGQTIANNGLLTTYTAYNHNTNDVVGLYSLEFPPAIQTETLRQLLQPLEQRRTLQSPHVLQVHDWGLEGKYIYIATDPPRGVTLQHVLDHENIDLQRAINLLAQIAQGLKELHARGFSGLDLRPLLITVDAIGTTDRVQIDDIGLRPLLHALGYTSQRSQDIAYRDPRYAAPEYIHGQPSGPWSDIYQAGLLLFELVSGRLPFVGRNAAETGVMQSTSPIPSINQYKHDAPDELQDIINAALAKDPQKRFSSAAALQTALEALSPTFGRIMPSPTAGLTREMTPVENKDDITLRSTLIEGRNTQPIANGTSPHEIADTVYAYLCFEKSVEEIQEIPITQKNVIIGRLDPKRKVSPDIDLSEFDPHMTISRQHARIRFEGTFFYIEDLKSRNKTRLGELVLAPLKAELLQHGDVLFFGSVRTVFKIPGMRDIPAFNERIRK